MSSSVVSDQFSSTVRPFLDLIDHLRSLGVQSDDISLPQIAVMGDQSSGKSSVLQAISGIPFPRGSGLVTRCPTQLIMKKSPSGTPFKAEVSVGYRSGSSSSSQLPGTGVFHSVTELTDTISRLTDALTNGKVNGFSTDSIVIKLSSPESPDLTIIDLPGIVRTSIQGQDTIVIEQVNDLINYYISQPQTIILAVVPSNQDVATIDILERAYKVDPHGSRTIGVLTKPDLINPGGEEEVLQVLRNVRKPLALGYIMLKNPNQKELNENISVQQARINEDKFFKEHLFFKTLQSNLFGVSNLTSALTKLLVTCIKDSLPSLKWELQRKLETSSAELAFLGKGLPTDERDKQSLIMEKISEFCKILRLSSRGDYREGVLANDSKYRLHAHMQKIYSKLQISMSELRPAGTNDNELMLQLEQEIISQRGRELPGFLSSQVFFSQVITLIEEFRPLVENCKAEIVAHTRNTCVEIANSLISSYPILNESISNIATELVDTVGDNAGLQLEALMTREQDPFTTHDILAEVVNGIRFRAFDNTLRQFLDTTVEPTPTPPVATILAAKSTKDKDDNKDKEKEKEKEKDAHQQAMISALKDDIRKKMGAWYIRRHGVDSKGNTQEMATLIQAYWDIASRRLADNVCMCLEVEFITALVRELETQCFLFGVSLDASKITGMLLEDPLIQTKRENLMMKVDKLTKSLKHLRDVAPEVIAKEAAPQPPPLLQQQINLQNASSSSTFTYNNNNKNNNNNNNNINNSSSNSIVENSFSKFEDRWAKQQRSRQDATSATTITADSNNNNNNNNNNVQQSQQSQQSLMGLLGGTTSNANKRSSKAFLFDD